jgi:hypothetical protein
VTPTEKVESCEFKVNFSFSLLSIWEVTFLLFVRLSSSLYLLKFSGRLHYGGLKWIICCHFNFILCHNLEVLGLQDRTDEASTNFLGQYLHSIHLICQ